MTKPSLSMKSALITGITGQDGSYLAEFLLAKGYKVHGLVRRTASNSKSRIQHLLSDVELHDADILDLASLIQVLRQTQAQEVYNLAAQSFVPSSFRSPVLTSEITGLGVLRLLEAVRIVNPEIRFYQASSSEMFGAAAVSPQNESVAFHPRSPYATAKVFAHHSTVNYREAYQLHASSGILFNHESPRRSPQFVTRKISLHAALIKQGHLKKLKLGNIHACRDWGYAKDYVEAMWLMLQQSEPGDYVVATGETHSVKDFCELAFKILDLNWQDHVEIDAGLKRPADVEVLCGDASKAKESLGWSVKTRFAQLVEIMVEHDMKLVADHGLPQGLL